MLLAFLGAGLGAAFAVWGTTALRIAPMIGAFPILFPTKVDRFTLAFAIVLGIACGLIFSAAPRSISRAWIHRTVSAPVRTRRPAAVPAKFSWVWKSDSHPSF